MDVHRALLVTGIPEDLEQTAIEAVLKPALLPLGKFRLRNTRAVRDEKAKASLMEFVKGIIITVPSPGRSRARTASGGFCARTARRARES